MSERSCYACGRPFDFPNGRGKYCPECKPAVFPVVYRFVCPDGRFYVGAVEDGRRRSKHGIGRSNSRLLEAFKQYPPEIWSYEVLERLTPGCSWQDRREAEQRHIDRLRSWDPAVGFNIEPAIWERSGGGPSQQAARQWRAEINRASRQRQKERSLTRVTYLKKAASM